MPAIRDRDSGQQDTNGISGVHEGAGGNDKFLIALYWQYGECKDRGRGVNF